MADIYFTANFSWTLHPGFEHFATCLQLAISSLSVEKVRLGDYSARSSAERRLSRNNQTDSVAKYVMATLATSSQH